MVLLDYELLWLSAADAWLQAVSRDEKEKLATMELWDMFGISKE